MKGHALVEMRRCNREKYKVIHVGRNSDEEFRISCLLISLSMDIPHLNCCSGNKQITWGFVEMWMSQNIKYMRHITWSKCLTLVSGENFVCDLNIQWRFYALNRWIELNLVTNMKLLLQMWIIQWEFPVNQQMAGVNTPLCKQLAVPTCNKIASIQSKYTEHCIGNFSNYSTISMS